MTGRRNVQRDDRIIELWEKFGWTQKQLAFEFGVSVSRIEKIFHDHRKRMKEHLEDMEELDREEKSWRRGCTSPSPDTTSLPSTPSQKGYPDG